jgi:hypothetical protein
MNPVDVSNPDTLTDEETTHIRPHIGKRLRWVCQQTTLLENEGAYKGRWSSFVEDSLKSKLALYYLRRNHDLERAYREPFISHPELLQRWVPEYIGDVQDDLEAAIANIENQDLADLPLAKQPHFQSDQNIPGVDDNVLEDLPLDEVEPDSPLIEMMQVATQLEKQEGQRSIKLITQMLHSWLQEDFDRRTFQQCISQAINSSSDTPEVTSD